MGPEGVAVVVLPLEGLVAVQDPLQARTQQPGQRALGKLAQVAQADETPHRLEWQPAQAVEVTAFGGGLHFAGGAAHPRVGALQLGGEKVLREDGQGKGRRRASCQ